MKGQRRQAAKMMVLSALLFLAACSQAQLDPTTGEPKQPAPGPVSFAQQSEDTRHDPGADSARQLEPVRVRPRGVSERSADPAIQEKIEYITAAYAEPLEFDGAEDKSSATLYFTYRGVRLKFMYDYLGRLFAVEMSSENTEDTAYRDLIVSTLFLDEIDLTQAEKEDFVMSLVITGRAQKKGLRGSYQGTAAWFSFQ